MAYTGKTPVNFVDVTQSQSMNVTDDLTVDTNTLVVDSANNRVGIGTNLPSANLDVASSNATIHLTDTDDTTYAEIRNNGGTFTIASDEGQSATNSSINFRVDGSERMRIDSSGNVDVYQGNKIRWRYAAGSTIRGSIETDSADNIKFFNGSSETERMRIDGSGNLLLNTQSSVGTTWFNLVGATSAKNGIAIKNASDAGTIYSLFIRNASNATIGSINNNGSTTSFTGTSDYRLKEDWQPMTGAIKRVNALNPVNFAWKTDGSRVDGFLAHEAQEVVPEAVVGKKDEMREEEYEVTPAVLDEDGNVVTEAVMGTRSVPHYQGIDQSKLVPLLTAALQEAIAKIETLETKVAALENA